MFRFLRDNYRLLVVLAPCIASYPILSHVALSFSDSAGGHVFWRTRCPESFERWDLVEVVPDSNDTHIPRRQGKPLNLLKHIACFPGETIRRQGLRFWCDTGEFELDLGLTKLEARDGSPLTPFTYKSGGNATSFLIPEGYYFVLGKPDTGSYDSRYFGPVEKERIVGCFKALF